MDRSVACGSDSLRPCDDGFDLTKICTLEMVQAGLRVVHDKSMSLLVITLGHKLSFTKMFDCTTQVFFMSLINERCTTSN